MPKTIKLDLDDQQLATLEQYIETQIEYRLDEKLKANVPYRKWETVELWAEHVFTQALAGPVAMFPSEAVKLKQAEILKLQREVEVHSSPKVS